MIPKTIAVLTLLILPVGGIFAADAKAGHAVYDKSCKSCHGADGAGNPAVAKMMKVDLKDLGSAEVQGESDADIKTVITEGKGKMKPIKSISASTADDVIAYI